MKKSKSKKHWSKKKNLWLVNFKSSNLAKVGYHVQKKTLYIEFKSGDSYKYTEVDVSWFLDFTLAESKGKYFSKAKMSLIHVQKIQD